MPLEQCREKQTQGNDPRPNHQAALEIPINHKVFHQPNDLDEP
jgi:hypothetical protein